MTMGTIRVRIADGSHLLLAMLGIIEAVMTMDRTVRRNMAIMTREGNNSAGSSGRIVSSHWSLIQRVIGPPTGMSDRQITTTILEEAWMKLSRGMPILSEEEGGTSIAIRRPLLSSSQTNTIPVASTRRRRIATMTKMTHLATEGAALLMVASNSWNKVALVTAAAMQRTIAMMIEDGRSTFKKMIELATG